jgi:hypothetical protein
MRIKCVFNVKYDRLQAFFTHIISFNGTRENEVRAYGALPKEKLKSKTKASYADETKEKEEQSKTEAQHYGACSHLSIMLQHFRDDQRLHSVPLFQEMRCPP